MSKRLLIAGAFLAGLLAGGMTRAGLGLTQSEDVAAAISGAAARHGVSEQRLRCLAFRESSWHPWAYNRAGYHGLLQFDWPTWRDGSRRAGWEGASPYDPYAAADVAAYLISIGEGWRWPPLRWC